MSAITDPLASPTSATGSPATGSGSQAKTDPLASEQTFLKLLVAQIQNQDPTNPTDPIQFVSQLTQYSELEQLIGINTGVQNLQPAPAPTGASTTPATGSTNGTPTA
jgi:flagellar basal-body rod modification protein FlgD